MTKRQQAPRPETRVLTDVRAIRALAHPARIAALEALSNAELTATECAALAGISPSAMSYHLRALEKWGIVERVEPGGDARERPWRTYPGGWSIEALPDAATAAAASAVTQLLLGRVARELESWFTAERDQPEAWRNTSGVANSRVWLTVDEATELQQRHREWVQDLRERSANEHPEGARRVRVTQIIVPLSTD